jgi:tRNA(adenine34) deaminase
MPPIHEQFMREAIAVARQGLGQGELPIGAVVVLDDVIVATSYTEELSQARLLVHAELLALDAADKILGARRREALLYTTLEPCLMCLGAAFSANVGTVVYALESPTDGAVEVAATWDRVRDATGMPFHRLPKIIGGVLRAESGALFREYVEGAERSDWLVKWANDLAVLTEG